MSEGRFKTRSYGLFRIVDALFMGVAVGAAILAVLGLAIGNPWMYLSGGVILLLLLVLNLAR
jgi:hypothetical protein